MSISANNLSRWYRETSQHLQAGVALPRALEIAGGVPKRYRRQLSEQLQTGRSVETVLREAPGWFPEIDRHVLAGAARSGKLAETLAVLANHREFVARETGRAAGAMVYPLFILHFLVLSQPVSLLFSSGTEAYLNRVLPILVPFWVVLAFAIWSVRRRFRWVRGIMRFIPLLRGHLKHQAVADLCYALGGYITAGVTIDAAWAGAAEASRETRLKRLGHSLSEKARLGLPPGSELEGSRLLPEDFISLYQAGEASGQLEENLHHLWKLYTERAAAKMRQASFWYPKLLLIAVAAVVVYTVVVAQMRRLDALLELM